MFMIFFIMNFTSIICSLTQGLPLEAILLFIAGILALFAKFFVEHKRN